MSKDANGNYFLEHTVCKINEKITKNKKPMGHIVDLRKSAINNVRL